ncbi:MAG: hypothetical protein HXM98_07420 [Porphyromonadaceae bacterium]|jgi:hypothetical protein|nr:hypothetical protein [Porphyromonadaceae bacterium]
MLTLDQDKLLYALLWFVQMNEVTDPVALDALSQGYFSEAARIWRQQVYTADGALRTITDRNSSAYHNLSVYLLCSTQRTDIISGVSLALMVLEQGSVLSFLQEKLGVNGLSLLDIELLYLNRLIEDISKRPRGGLSQLMELLSQQEYVAKVALMKSYALEAVNLLEQAIEQSVNQSKTVTGCGLVEGEKLLEEGCKALEQIGITIPKSDPKYQRVSNALAKGIKSCAEEYFDDCSDRDDFASQRLLELYRKTQAFACSDFVHTELCKKIEKLEEWIREAPQRKAEAKVKEEVDGLSELSDRMLRFDPDTIPNVEKFVAASEVFLLRIKRVLGDDSPVYRKYSTLVAMVAIKSLVAIVNEAQANLIQSFEAYGAGTLKTMRAADQLKEVLRGAWKLTLQLESFGLDGDYRNGAFKKNKEVLKDLCKECLIPTTSAGGRRSTPFSSLSANSSRPSISYSASPSSRSNDTNWGQVIGIIIATIVLAMTLAQC